MEIDAENGFIFLDRRDLRALDLDPVASPYPLADREILAKEATKALAGRAATASTVSITVDKAAFFHQSQEDWELSGALTEIILKVKRYNAENEQPF